MIEGTVNARNEAEITLALQGPTGQMLETDAVIDTGYSGYLTLPPTIVNEMGLPYAGFVHALLADGSRTPFDLYRVTVSWDGMPRQIDAYESNSIPLVGMAMLNGHNLNIDVQRGGRVVIQAMFA